MRKLATLAVLALPLCGCVPLVIGGGAYAISKATSERGLGGTVSDVQVQSSINKLWWDNDADMMKRLDLTVTEGRVLITGRARDPEQKMKAAELAWRAKGVVEVTNEATLENTSTLTDEARDIWISTQLRTFLTLDGEVAGRNYTINTINRVVYLMGYARSQSELSRVTSHASTITGVQKVISYVRVGNEGPGAFSPTPQDPLYQGN